MKKLKFLSIFLLILVAISSNSQNNALNFTAANNSAVNCGNNPVLRLTSTVTLEAWVNRSSNSWQAIISKLVHEGDREGYGIEIENNRLVFIIGNNWSNWCYTYYDVALTFGQWYHIAGTYDGTTAKIYIDGKLVGTQSYTNGIVDSQTPLYIGCRTNSGCWADGQIDEARVWNVARTEAQIKANMYKELVGNEAGLVAYYKFNEGSGTTLYDATSNHNDGTLLNVPTWKNSGALAGSRNALDFDGSNDYVQLAVNSQFDYPGNSVFTFESWIYFTGGGNSCLFSKGGFAGQTEYSLYIDNASKKLIFNIAKQSVAWQTIVTSVSNIPTNTWVHVAVAKTATAASIYLNGIYDATGTLNATTLSATSSTAFGIVIGGKNFAPSFYGKMDEVRFWNTTRSETEIRSNMTKTLAGNEANLVACYRFDESDGIKLYDLTSNAINGTLTNMDGATDWVPSTAFSTWIGSESNAWNTAGNWSGNTTPAATDNIGVYKWNLGSAPLITSAIGSPATCNNLYINSGATLTINAAKALTINGNYINNGILSIKSTVLGDGSLLTNGAVSGTGTTKVARSIASNKWHLVSSPVTSALSGVLNGLYLRPYLEGSDIFGAYITSTTDPLGVGQGYSLWANSNAIPVFSGTPNNGSVGPILTPLTLNGYNLVGNPYPSAIDWNAASGWTKTNLAATIYVWNPNIGQYATYNGAIGTNDGSRYIAMGQGFFVQANSGGGSLTMNNNVRVHNAIAFMKSDETLADKINIKVSNSLNSYSDETIIALNDTASAGFDYDLDANKFAGETTAPMLYTMKDDKNLAVSCLSSIDNIYNRDVYFKAGVSGTHTLIFTHTMVNNEVYLLDEVTQEIIYNGDVYNFEASPTDDLSRFMIVSTTTSVNEKSQSQLNAYAYHKTLYVKVENQYVNSVELYTLDGRKLLENTNLINDISSLSAGIYLVKVKTDKDVLCKKIAIQ
ncbi:MAG: T9SS type A sorting domain-containing protein [Bacteroidetes bacterium]|nr:T9SS type A sorting domain-containing protein [Bacteroidota bacterium]